jgi:glucokinase
MTVTIGVDVGGTKILGGVVGADGEIREITRVDSPREDAEASLHAIIDVIRELSARSTADITAVGIGIAGLVANDRSVVITAPNLGWSHVDVGSYVRDATGIVTVVENDANAAAWGEFLFGAGQQVRDIVAVTVGTGIGGGLILDGRLRRGSHGVAAEIGHLNAVPDGRPCGCGRRGCLEQYASGHALVRAARERAAAHPSRAIQLLRLGDGTPEGITGVDVTTAARAGDTVALESFTEVGTWLGRGLADLAAVIDPEAFIIGGGVSEAGDLLLASARATLREKVIGKDGRPVPVVIPAQLGNHAGLVGAADLARLRE